MHRRRAEKFRDIPWMALESQSEAKNHLQRERKRPADGKDNCGAVPAELKFQAGV